MTTPKQTAQAALASGLISFKPTEPKPTKPARIKREPSKVIAVAPEPEPPVKIEVIHAPDDPFTVKPEFAKVELLTNRQFEIFELLGTGKTPAEIGVTLSTKRKTVEQQIAGIKLRLGVPNLLMTRVLAVRWVAYTERHKVKRVKVHMPLFRFEMKEVSAL